MIASSRPPGRSYVVRRARQAVPLSGQVAGTPWADAHPLSVDVFPWYTAGRKQPTTARLLYDAQAVYAQFQCLDKHSAAVATELNGPVWEDSCVEFFATIDPDSGPDYFNLEMNCCGQFLVGFGPGRKDRKPITPELARNIRICSSLPGPTKRPSADDEAWWVAVALPFAVLGELTGRKVQPASGTTWRANFYRCGGPGIDNQYACWSPIDTPRPDFHRPEFFSPIVFE